MKRKKQKGITLIEVIIVMAITGIIMAAVTMMFTSNTNILSQIDHNSELQLEAQQIQEQLSTVALECSGVTDIGQDYLILKDSENPEEILHQFNLEQGELTYRIIQKKDSEETVINTKVLSRSVEIFEVIQNDNLKTIDYQIVLKKSQGKTAESLTIKNKILFRNY